jgi:hypothetical protein
MDDDEISVAEVQDLVKKVEEFCGNRPIQKTNLMWLAANPNALPYGPGPLMSPENFSLNNRKSTNVNIWVVTQKLNLYQHKINLK